MLKWPIEYETEEIQRHGGKSRACHDHRNIYILPTTVDDYDYAVKLFLENYRQNVGRLFLSFSTISTWMFLILNVYFIAFLIRCRMGRIFSNVENANEKCRPINNDIEQMYSD